ncbi:hypothetical protein F5I97DRAFT_1799851 [Phlebopus sp. FC_14]|nr:hypothetical protein F5I97DRAFT_1799851 [Phlebopus sp. FC_14]
MASRKVPLSIDFIVIGAGVTGLATAFRLCQIGHRVHVIEKATGPNQRTGGAHLPPNLTKVLVEWGLEIELQKYGLSTRATQFVSMEDGNVLGCLEWKEDVLQETGADYLVMKHADLTKILYEAAVSAGVRFSFNTSVTFVQSEGPHSDRPCVTLQDGTTLEADLIVGADGPRGIMREMLTGDTIQEEPEGHSVYVASVSRELFKADEELYKFTAFHPERPDYPLWTGNSCHAIGMTTAKGAEFSLHIFLPEEMTEGNVDDAPPSDGAMVAREKLTIACEPNDIRLRRLLSYIPEFQRKRMMRREFCEDWVDESGKLLIMGEAAYPIWPCCLQSCSMQVEDAGVLSTLFTQLSSRDQIPHFMEAFQEIRQPRAQFIFSKETKSFETVWIPPGPVRAARDEVLRKMMTEGRKGWNEDKLRWQWEEICEVFGYHAREAAEDWWVMWGLLRERSKEINASNGLHMTWEARRNGPLMDNMISEMQRSSIY